MGLGLGRWLGDQTRHLSKAGSGFVEITNADLEFAQTQDHIRKFTSLFGRDFPKPTQQQLDGFPFVFAPNGKTVIALHGTLTHLGLIQARLHFFFNFLEFFLHTFKAALDFFLDFLQFTENIIQDQPKPIPVVFEGLFNLIQTIFLVDKKMLKGVELAGLLLGQFELQSLE